MKGPLKQVTRRDVAIEANVSETIVSYVMNNNRYVDKEKKIRVEKAIKRLNYHPNNIARALKGKSSNHIAFIVDQIITEHFSLLVSEMDKKAYDLGYMISLCANRNTQEFVDELINRCYDGIIISSISFSNENIKRIVNAGIPVVLLENRDYDEIIGAGKINNGLYLGAKQCVKYLVEKGCKNIIYIDRFSERGNFSNMKDLRYRGFVEQMQEIWPSKDVLDNIITMCKDEIGVEQKVQEYITHHKVDGIIGRNDKMACIAMKTVQKMNFRVPQDIAVIGFDNSTLVKYTTPPITSVGIQREQIAKAAIKMLQTMINSHVTPKPVTFITDIVERESTNSDISH